MTGILFAASIATYNSGPHYTVTPTHTSVDEGVGNDFVFSSTNTVNVRLYWRITDITGTNMNDSRFDQIEGDCGVSPGIAGGDSGAITVSADMTTSPDQQSYTFRAYSDSARTHEVCNVTITVNDTSQTPSYTQPTIPFTLVNPPVGGVDEPWADSATGVTAIIKGTWYYDSAYGGGVQLAGEGWLELQGGANTSPTLTLSFATDLEPQIPNWNSLYSGGFVNDIFAYVNPDGSGIRAGLFQDYGAGAGYTHNIVGLAWYDFVYDSQSLTIYRNGVQVAQGTLAFANTGWDNPLLIGKRYGSQADQLHGTIYQIRYHTTAMSAGAIVTQYNSQASTYGLTPVSPPATVPTGSIVARFNNPWSYGGPTAIWSDASGYQWAKVMNLGGVTPADNNTYGFTLDSSSGYIQTPIHINNSNFTFAFTARLNHGASFPSGIFDCSTPGNSTGLRAYWSDATSIIITSPNAGSPSISLSGTGWNPYSPAHFVIRMTLNNISNNGVTEIFVNGTKLTTAFGTPNLGSGFLPTDPSIKMILGALYNNDNTGQTGFSDSTWYNFIYYSRALSDSEVTQLYAAQQAKLFALAPPTSYSFNSNFSATLSNPVIYIGIGMGIGPTVPPDSMTGWTVTGPGITGSATVSGVTTIVNATQFTIPISQSITQGMGTYTFTAS